MHKKSNSASLVLNRKELNEENEGSARPPACDGWTWLCTFKVSSGFDREILPPLRFYWAVLALHPRAVPHPALTIGQSRVARDGVHQYAYHWAENSIAEGCKGLQVIKSFTSHKIGSVSNIYSRQVEIKRK